MIQVDIATEAGTPQTPNEDWAGSNETTVVVLDGSTTRTETGCSHGVSWYVANLGASLIHRSSIAEHSLQDVLAGGIADVAALHPECNLKHPGTPSAAVSIVRLNGQILEYLVLADTYLALDLLGGITTVSDNRVSLTARGLRDAARELPIGSPERDKALREMKEVELSQRNRPGGFWVAAADESAAQQAYVGSYPANDVTQFVVMTDGAARGVVLFKKLSWRNVFQSLEKFGALGLIREVRELEFGDVESLHWPRNKSSDDATAAYVKLNKGGSQLAPHGNLRGRSRRGSD